MNFILVKVMHQINVTEKLKNKLLAALVNLNLCAQTKVCSQNTFPSMEREKGRRVFRSMAMAADD
jgi:hypothetical protein